MLGSLTRTGCALWGNKVRIVEWKGKDPKQGALDAQRTTRRKRRGGGGRATHEISPLYVHVCTSTRRMWGIRPACARRAHAYALP